MTKYLPTLTENHWLEDSLKKLDMLFSHFLVSTYSQTYVYDKQISSLSWLLEQYGSDSTDFATELKITLERYIGRYYKSVDVVSQSKESEERPGRYEVIVDINVIDDNDNEYNIGRVLLVEKSTLISVLKLLNEG